MRPPAKPKEDTRRKKRITKVLPVDCTLVSLPLNRTAPHYISPGDSFGGRTINISQTGLQVHSDIELDTMTVVDVTVYLDRPPDKITVRTQVAWAKRNAADLYGRWSMGLHIIEARPGDLQILHAFYNSLT
jgi:PilZ domain